MRWLVALALAGVLAGCSLLGARVAGWYPTSPGSDAGLELLADGTAIARGPAGGITRMTYVVAGSRLVVCSLAGVCRDLAIDGDCLVSPSVRVCREPR